MSSHCRLLIARATKLIKYLKLWKLKRIRKTLFPVFSLYYFQPTCSCYLRSIPLSLNLNKEYYAVPVLLCCPNYSFKTWSSISTQVKIISLIKSDPMRSCMLPQRMARPARALPNILGCMVGLEHPKAAAPTFPVHYGWAQWGLIEAPVSPVPCRDRALHGFPLVPFCCWHGHCKSSEICTQNNFQMCFKTFTTIIPIKNSVFLYCILLRKESTTLLKLFNAKTRWILKKSMRCAL